MAQKFPNQGEGIILAYLVNKDSPSNLTLRLFTNNITPGNTDDEGDYTEASGDGYAAIALTGASWAIVEGAPSEASYAQQEFTFTGALGNVYGYFYTRDSDDKLTSAERFADAPFNISANGQKIRITPKITCTTA
jgi:hypothetical protein